jgi:hypothetical protein
MPLEFGLQLKSFPPDGGTELLGFYDRQVAALPPAFTSLWVSDHLQFGDDPVLEGWTWLTYLAARCPGTAAGRARGRTRSSSRCGRSPCLGEPSHKRWFSNLPTDQTATRYRIHDGSGGHDEGDRPVEVRPTR